MNDAPRIEIIASGRIDQDDSAFPRAVALPDGELLCSYSNAGGSWVTGGTGLPRSTDRRPDVASREGHPARERDAQGQQLPQAQPDRGRVGAVRVRVTLGGRRRARVRPRTASAVLCTSTDRDRTWPAPATVPMPSDLLEISDAVLVTSTGRLLAPAAIIEPGRLGEQDAAQAPVIIDHEQVHPPESGAGS